METRTKKKTAIRYVVCFSPLLLMMLMMPIDAFAASNPITEGLNWFAQMLTETWARVAAIIACAACGYMAWMQILTLRFLMYFVLGCVFVFGASAFVDSFQSNGVSQGGFSMNRPAIQRSASELA